MKSLQHPGFILLQRISDSTKVIKNYKASGVDSAFNYILKYGVNEVRCKLLKIIYVIFEKGEVSSNFRKTPIKSIYEKCDKSECGELLSLMTLSRL